LQGMPFSAHELGSAAGWGAAREGKTTPNCL
jgi:hypothetical protein